MDEQRAIQLCVQHRDPVGFEFLVHKYRREAFFHAFALLGNQEDEPGHRLLLQRRCQRHQRAGLV